MSDVSEPTDIAERIESVEMRVARVRAHVAALNGRGQNARRAAELLAAMCSILRLLQANEAVRRRLRGPS